MPYHMSDIIIELVPHTPVSMSCVYLTIVIDHRYNTYAEHNVCLPEIVNTVFYVVS